MPSRIGLQLIKVADHVLRALDCLTRMAKGIDVGPLKMIIRVISNALQVIKHGRGGLDWCIAARIKKRHGLSVFLGSPAAIHPEPSQ